MSKSFQPKNTTPREGYVVILITCASKKEAGEITESLLKKHLIACANMIPRVESRFWWKGKISKTAEAMLILKTHSKNFSKIEREVKRIHSYEVPEIIALRIANGNKAYLKWINENLRSFSAYNAPIRRIA